jgi:hypothetical protein
MTVRTLTEVHTGNFLLLPSENVNLSAFLIPSQDLVFLVIIGPVTGSAPNTLL